MQTYLPAGRAAKKKTKNRPKAVFNIFIKGVEKS